MYVIELYSYYINRDQAKAINYVKDCFRDLILDDVEKDLLPRLKVLFFSQDLKYDLETDPVSAV